MTAYRLLSVSAVCWTALVLLVVTGSGSLSLGLVVLSAGLATLGGVVFGLPPLVLAGTLAALGSAVATAGTGTSVPLVTTMALVLWVGVETAWRATDLADLVATAAPRREVAALVDRAWLMTVTAVAVGTVAVGLVVASLVGRVSEGGLGVWMGAVAVVVLAAGGAGFGLLSGRWRDPAVAARGSGSPGPGPRTGSHQRG